MGFSRTTKTFMLVGAPLVSVMVVTGLWTTHPQSGTQQRAGAAGGHSTPAAHAQSKAHLAATASSGSAHGVERRPVVGTFTLWAATPRADPCAPRSDAADIHRGTLVAVHNTSGVTLAATRLSAGRAEATHRGCVYRFTLTPRTAAAFSIAVGTRFGLTYTPRQLAKADWQVALNLGLPDPAAAKLQVPAASTHSSSAGSR
jgi:hypothetical protein